MANGNKIDEILGGAHAVETKVVTEVSAIRAFVTKYSTALIDGFCVLVGIVIGDLLGKVL